MPPVYLDCNATTPLETAVVDALRRFHEEEFGNAGSRTHDYGARAKQATQKARDSVAAIAGAKRDEVVFTSGATESNNLAILGLAGFAERNNRRHIVSTQIEHKAVLEPLAALEKRGFEVTLVSPTPGGWIDADDVAAAVREDTVLVSVMHANNETGVLQPIADITEKLRGHDAFLHVDAAQGFGKEIEPLQDPRVDLISVSGHKMFGPKGVGALIARRRGYDRPPLEPLIYGGGQERGLRPGTLPVALLAALGTAAELALRDHEKRADRCRDYRRHALEALGSLDPAFNGDPDRALPHVLNISFPGVDSEALMVTLKDLMAVSNGSACTSASYAPSHVLKAMGLGDERIQGAVRISWCHLTAGPDWSVVADRIKRLL